MSYTVSVNPKRPTRTVASEPLRRRFHNTGGCKVISIPMFICIFVKCVQYHCSSQSHEIPIYVRACILVGKTKQSTE